MKNSSTFLIILLVSSWINANSQCENGRYRDKLFPIVQLQSDVVYGQNLNYFGQEQQLLLDVYQPAGDIAEDRPLVIVAHGGYFLGGDKTDESAAPLCHELARMGYVTASIGYRIGINLTLPLNASFTEAIMRSVQDMKAAIRFFRKSAMDQGNPYRIDPNKIYVGGVSAGGFVALHLAYLDADEVPPIVNWTNAGLSGGLEGNSGNSGYSSAIDGVFSIAGAIGDTTWIEPGGTPAFLAHGSEDSVVPFGSDTLTLLGIFDVAEVDGSNSINQKMNEVDIDHCFEIYWGQDHVPQQGLEAYFDTTLSILSNFLSHRVCPSIPLDCEYRTIITGVEDLNRHADVKLFPNPSQTVVSLSNQDARISRIWDATGRCVMQGIASHQCDIRLLHSGLYWVEIELHGHRWTQPLQIIH